MSILQSESLIESKSLRTETLRKASPVDLESVLMAAKVHGLFQALWKGEGWATTAQVAEYYEVANDLVRLAVSRHRDEFKNAGYATPKRSELSPEENSIISILCDGRKLPALFNPRAAVLLGMLLRDSKIAKAVRAALLKIAENHSILVLEVERLRDENQRLRDLLESNQQSASNPSSQTAELLGEMARVVEAYIDGSRSLNQSIHTSIHRQSESLRLAFENLKRLHEKTYLLPEGAKSLDYNAIADLARLTPRLNTKERRAAITAFLELIDTLPEDDERKKWSSRQIGNYLGVSYRTVCDIINERKGKKEPPMFLRNKS
ncbi:hypothetical protein [Iningainema tapete]|uniref:Uncharacterized protein n=1 Tax=Iningainema tapete BLCC-T55 TaxID=2748662 RepID=A0A8J6XAD2_9CYAN|nr:hypothetical protein [Iningainema tapete]MBD2770679.1 hypothetical protein [Iningainema tapete BLCC-T55]